MGLFEILKLGRYKTEMGTRSESPANRQDSPGTLMDRRRFLEVALTAMIVQACGGVMKEVRTAVKTELTPQAKNAGDKENDAGTTAEILDKKDPFEYVRQALEKLPPFPVNGSLKERINRAKADNKLILDIVSTHIEEFAKILCENEPMPWEMLKQIPYPDLEEGLGAIENITFVWDWFNIVAHLVQSDITGKTKLIDEALNYMQANLGTVFHDDAEAHVMAIESELMEAVGQDPRLMAVLEARFKRGINRDSGSNRMHEEASLVRHLPRKNYEEALPPTEELSWGMLIAARSGKKYQEPALKLTDPEGKSFILTPENLVPIAQNYCGLLIHFFENLKRKVSAKKTKDKGKYNVENNFTERGAHLIHGVLVLLGKYGKEIEASDPDAYRELMRALKRVILLHIEHVNKGIEIKSEEKCNYAGHLLQAILDSDAAAIFEVGGEMLTGKQVVEKHFKNLETPLIGNPQSDLEIVAWACQGSASDIRPLLMKFADKPNSIPIRIGHIAAGLERLAGIMR